MKKKLEGIAWLSMYNDGDKHIFEAEDVQQKLGHSDNTTTTNFAKLESDSPYIDEEALNVEIDKLESESTTNILENFLPPSPQTTCSDHLQEKINKFLALKKAGRSFNTELRNRKDYRNPDFLLHAVSYQDIDPIGSCFPEDVFNPHGYDKSDFYDEIEADMVRETEMRKRKEQEMQMSQQVQFVNRFTQLGMKIPFGATGNLAVSAAVEPVVRDSRKRKNSKWDVVN